MSDFTGLVLVVTVIVIMISIRVYAGHLDRERIREHLESHGGKVIDIVWAPFGAGWATVGKARLYDVRYRTHHGTLVTAKCATSMFTDVWWLRDAPPGFAREAEAGASTSPEEIRRSLATPAEPITCLSCGAKIPARDACCPKCGWTYQGQATTQ